MKPGDTLYFVPSRGRGQPHTVEVLKVGRVWVYLSTMGYKVEAGRDVVKSKCGGFSVGTIYPSEQAYNAIAERLRAWDKLRDLVHLRRSPPEGFTPETAEQVRKLLGL